MREVNEYNITKRDLLDAAKPHYTTAIVGAAVAAAASAAQQAAAAARQRKQQAQAAQEAKQGMPGGGGGSGSVAESLLGQAGGLAQNPRIQSMFQGDVKKVAGPADAGLAPTGGGATQAFSQGQPMMGDMQSQFAGQNPDYLKLMQQPYIG